MKIRTLVGAGAALLLAAACVPSVHPFYQKDQVVFEPTLIGRWTEATDSSGDAQTWDFEKGQTNGYKLLITEKEGKKGLFDAFLFKLGEGRFLDLTPAEVNMATNEADLVSASLIPGHLLFRVLATEPSLKLALLDADWVQKYLTDHPSELAHARKEDQVFLTATTSELQRFIQQHLGKDELFGKPADFRKTALEKK